ncbi:MAG TPA: MFS transporter [Novosphingobium sp.]|nr:MFS transporter [Novosphingobium sp.]
MESQAAAQSAPRPAGLLGPLQESPPYRLMWMTGLLANLGQLIQNVGAAWEMTRLTGSAEMVALVQSAAMLPLMLVALPAGAIADMFDRRKVAIAGLSFAGLSAALLTLAALFGMTSPALLLGSCFLIGSGVALYAPAWQSSVREQVSAAHLPAAIALNSISYNVARSVGPAIGGVLLASLGAAAAFGANVLLYLPLILALLAWRRTPVPSRLPGEHIGRAIVSGVRYVFHSPPIRIVLARTFLSSVAGASIAALLPFVARDLIGGGALTYGLLLGCYGVGAIGGAMCLHQLRTRFAPEAGVRGCMLIAGLMTVIVAFSPLLPLTCLALAIFGAVWMLIASLFNVGVQLSAPRWVAARAVSCYTCAITGGIALGAWAWGYAAVHVGTAPALYGSAAAIALVSFLGVISPMPRIDGPVIEREGSLHLPEISLALTHRSGPIVIEVDYRVRRENAREFYNAMRDVRRGRLRTGGFDWSLSRDISDPERWTERYHCPTWGDYLRQRDRLTAADIQAHEYAQSFNADGGRKQNIRRMLERPLGSVRYRADTPDPLLDGVEIYTP